MSLIDPPDGWLPEELQRVADVVRAGRPGDDVEARVVRVNAAVDAMGSGAPIPTAQAMRRTTGIWYAVAMATVSVIAMIGIVSGRHWQGRTYATIAGETLHIALTDGTQVTLAPRSALMVGGDRQVTLEGEAYFSVIHDQKHPFAVLARNVRVTDVGTEFDVRDDDDDIRVAVAQGSVVVGAGLRPARSSPNGISPFFPKGISHSFPNGISPSFQEVSLFAGDMATVVDGVPTVTHHANIASAIAWLQGTLIFDKTPLREVVQDIERTFGVTIVIADSTLMTKRITSALSGQPLPLVLDVVTRTIGARYEQHSGKIIIRAGQASVRDTNDHVPAPLITARAPEDHP